MREWLIRYIDRSFRGVTLDSEIDIYTAESLDAYGDSEEDALSQKAERKDWRLVPLADLRNRPFASGYFDAAAYVANIGVDADQKLAVIERT